MSPRIRFEFSGPGTWKGILQRAALKVYRENHRDTGDLPTSATFIFYELEGLGIVSKNPVNSRTGARRKRTHRQDVSDALLVLRRAGLIPWEDIADETRVLTEWSYSASVYAYAREAIAGARIDAWGGGPPPVVVCESRSLSGVLRPITYEYLAPVTATNGQSAGHLHVNVAPLLTPGRCVLYLGDFDHAGGQIEANTRRELEEIVGRSLDWERVAITQQQIVDHDPKLEPIWKTDNRYRNGLEHEAWETEALGQGAVVALVGAALESLLPGSLEETRAREREQRRDVLKRLTP